MSSHPLARLGWRAELQSDLDAIGDPSLVAARVTGVDRGSVVVDSGPSGWRAPLSGRLRRASAMPATGDFVAVLRHAGLRSVAPLEDSDEPVPLLDKAQVKRERRARDREFGRTYCRSMREKRHSRERRDRRAG